MQDLHTQNTPHTPARTEQVQAGTQHTISTITTWRTQVKKKKHTHTTKQQRMKAVEQMNAVMAHIERYAEARRLAKQMARHPKNEGRPRGCSTMSKWQREHPMNMPSETDEGIIARTRTPHSYVQYNTTPAAHEIVILYDRHTHHGDIYEVVERGMSCVTVKHRRTRRKVTVVVAPHKYEPDDTEVVIHGIIMTAKQMQISLQSTGTKIYDIDEII